MHTAFRRFYKQIIIATIFLIVVLGVSFWVWRVTRPQPTCSDGIKNQNEQDIDCGGICALACMKEPMYGAVSLLRTQFFKVSESAYDVIGEVENKNIDFGSPSFGYEFALLDAEGEVLASRKGTSYILPREKKRIGEQRLETSKPVASVRLTMFDEVWIEVNEFASANLYVRNKEFSPVFERSSPAGYKASGVVVNQTGFDFGQVDIVVVLKDDSGKELAIGVTEMRTLKNGDQRFFEVRWPYPLSDVSRFDVDAYTNLLANENFLVRYGKNRERFQEEVPVPSKGIRF
ncbi:MAG: FxLYD domain-containing protein [bacterium]|nr:FxLYD domain-containing protein [bacterium]